MYNNAIGIMLSTIAHMDGGGIPTNHTTIKSVIKDRQKFLLENKQKFETIKRDMGLEKFFYGENFVWSRDQRNADRKAKNKGFI